MKRSKTNNNKKLKTEAPQSSGQVLTFYPKPTDEQLNGLFLKELPEQEEGKNALPAEGFMLAWKRMRSQPIGSFTKNGFLLYSRPYMEDSVALTLLENYLEILTHFNIVSAVDGCYSETTYIFNS